MVNLKIIVRYEEKYFLPNNHNEVFTELYLSAGDICFPNVGWSDFTDTVLQWWANELINIRHTINHSTKLYFKDGPFWLEVFKDDKMELRINCINSRGNKDIVELTVECGYVEFLQVLLDAIKEFMYILHFSYPDKKVEKFYQPHFTKLSSQLKDIITELMQNDDA